MTTNLRVLYDAINSLAEDREFARTLTITGSRRLVEYLMRRGAGETEAELLALAYFSGRMHESEDVSRIFERLGTKP